MSNIRISPAQRRILEEAYNNPAENIENHTSHLSTMAQHSVLEALTRKGFVMKKGYCHYITENGLNIISPTNITATTIQHKTKQSLVIGLLSEPEGATLQQIISATNWQAHTVRGYISNLRKKRGLLIETFTTTDGKHGYKIIDQAS